VNDVGLESVQVSSEWRVICSYAANRSIKISISVAPTMCTEEYTVRFIL